MTTDILLITFIFAVILVVMVILERRDSQSTKDMIRSFAIKCGDRWILPTGTRTDWIDVTNIVNAITKQTSTSDGQNHTRQNSTKQNRSKHNKPNINIQNGRKCYNKASEIKGNQSHEHWYNRLVSKLFRFH